MKDNVNANELRQKANVWENIAAEWLEMAKNKTHHKNIRIAAARRYRANMRLVQEYRDRAKKYE